MQESLVMMSVYLPVWLHRRCRGAGETARKGKGGNHFKDNQWSCPGKYLDCACV